MVDGNDGNEEKGMIPTEAFHEMERRDEAQIIAELEGKYLDEFVYQFKSGNRMVTGVSWAGIKEIAYKMGGIQVDLIELKETETAYSAIVKAHDVKNNASRLGVSTQKKMMKRRSGGEYEDDFALQKVMSKAQRNAIRPLVPETMLKVYIEGFLERQGTSQKNRKQVKADVEEPKEPERAPGIGPPPKQTPEKEEAKPVVVEKLPEGVADIYELDGILKARIPGYLELLNLAPVTDGVAIEHLRSLDEELEALLDHMVGEMGGERMKRGGLYGVDWVVPWRK